MTKLVALTGNIGSGKSYVSTLFGELGIPIFYSDIEAKKTYFDNDIKQALTKHFGNDIYINDHTINKPLLTHLVFGDKASGQYIESLLYPALHKHFEEWALKQDSPYVLYESAIVFEKHINHLFDAIIMVTASETTRLRRVMLRDACDEHTARTRMAAQWSDETKSKLADYVITHENDDEDDYLTQQVLDIHRVITKETSILHRN